METNRIFILYWRGYWKNRAIAPTKPSHPYANKGLKLNSTDSKS
jgi:hypothetical protein